MKTFIFTTKNLGFRLLQKDDSSYWIKLYEDPDVTQLLVAGSRSQEQAQDKINAFISSYEKKGLPCFLMFEINSSEFVGRSGFASLETGEIEVGYVLQKKFWGKGYATEALGALLKWAKTHINAEYVIAYTPLEHHTSQRVMQKCGMEHYKDDSDKDGEYRFYRAKIK